MSLVDWLEVESTMFKLYLFFSDMRDLYNASDDNDSASIIDMARRMFRTYDRQSMITLRDACLKTAKFIGEEIQDPISSYK